LIVDEGRLDWKPLVERLTEQHFDSDRVIGGLLADAGETR